MRGATAVFDGQVPSAGVAPARMRVAIGVPWVLVLLYALALITSSMLGLAMACSLL